MRISHFGLLKFGAVPALLCALPCLGQSAPAAKSNPLSGLIAPGLQQKTPENLQQLLQQKLSKTFRLKSSPEEAIPMVPLGALPAQHECYDLKVFRFKKGFPSKDATAQPTVSDCTSAALYQEKNLVMGAKALTGTQQR